MDGVCGVSASSACALVCVSSVNPSMSKRKVKKVAKATPKTPASKSHAAPPKGKKSKSPGKKRQSETALAPNTAAIALKGAKEKELFAEAAHRASTTVKGTEELFSSYGEWLFIHVFASDTTAILDESRDNPVWSALLHSADTGHVQLSRTSLSTMVRVAAFDKRLADGAWNALTYSMKVVLLPLREPNLLREGARHVLSASCTIRQAREWVENTLRPSRAPALRLSPVAAQKAVGSLVKKFGDPKYAHKMQSALSKLPEDKRAVAKEGLETLIERLQQMLAAVKKD